MEKFVIRMSGGFCCMSSLYSNSPSPAMLGDGSARSPYVSAELTLVIPT